MAQTIHYYLEGVRLGESAGSWYLNECNAGGGCTTTVDNSNWVNISNDGNVGYFHTNFFGGQDGAVVVFDLQAFTLASNQRCANLRYNILGGSATDPGVSRIDVFLRASGKPDHASVVIQQGITWTWYSPYSNTGEWTQASINDARVVIRDSIGGGGTGAAAISAINWDLDIRTQPVVTVTGPSGTGQPSNPAITWNCNLQGDAARKFQVLLRRTSDNALIYDSGELFGGGSSGNSWNVGNTVAGVQYYAQVRQASDFNGGEYWSNYANSANFTIAKQPVATITAPSGVGHSLTPTVTWTNDFSNNTPRAYQVRILNAAQTQVVYDSGRIGGQATSLVTGTVLQPGTTYHAQVRIANDLQGGDFWSNYSGGNFDTATIPAVVVTGPSGTITTTNQPNVTWTYTSTGAQKEYVVKIFAQQDYDSVGFDPETWSASWNSGVITGTQLLQKVLQALPANVTFKAFVKAANVNGTYSPWASL